MHIRSLPLISSPYILLAALWAVFSIYAESAHAVQVSVPLRFELSIVREAIIKQIFNEPGETAIVLNDNPRCRFLAIRQPQVTVVGGRLHIISPGNARLGFSIKNRCILSFKWQGFIEIFAEPHFDPNANILSFKITDSNIYDEKRKKRFTSGRLWDAVKTHVHPRLAVLAIDFSKPLNELRTMLPLMLPGSEEEIHRLLATVRISPPQLYEDSLGMTISFDAEQRPSQTITTPERALTPEEIERWHQSWQRWDAFITFIVKCLARDNSGAVLMRLREALLDTRYELLEVLEQAGLKEPDPVPMLFVKTWDRLKPIMREIATGISGEGVVHSASFVAGADALAALVQAGPGFGLEISADSLRSLARLLVPDSMVDPVAYTTTVDPELRRMLGFGEPLPPPDISSEADLEARLPGTEIHNTSLLSGLFALVIPDASAAVDSAAIRRLNRWVPDKEELETYLLLVRDLLITLSEETAAGGKLDAKYNHLFRNAILTTAWQESCWRQFVRRGKKIVPLKSMAGSVGLMQVNQHVWRGVYEIRGLQGDIAYNGRAGCEIFLHYLMDYAIAQGEHQRPGGVDNLARSTYAIYNAGPAHISRYRSPGVKKSLKKIDALWWKKYQTVKDGREMNVVECFE